MLLRRRPLREALPLLAVLSLLATSLPSQAQTAPAAAADDEVTWVALDATATLSLDRSVFASLGWRVDDAGTPRAHAQHPLSVAPKSAPSYRGVVTAWSATIGADGFRAFERGGVTLEGGFVLRPRDGRSGFLDFSRLELAAVPGTSRIQFLDAAGVAWFETASAQWQFDLATGSLRYLNADVRVGPAFARHLGDARYEGVTVGVLAIDATFRGAAPPQPQLVDGGPPPCGDWSGNIDVGLVNMSSIGQAGISVVNGRSVVVVLPSAELENLGTANVPWFSKFTLPGHPTQGDQHPFLVWQMGRISGGVLEPLGRSDLKHAFLTINTGCEPGACTTGNTLGIGCADVYGTSTNNSVNSLAPRSEITASTGIWAHCNGIPSHFDTNGDCTQDFSGSGENAFTHGMKVAESDLQVAGATYFVEAFYVVRDDINILNSMGKRQVTPAKPGSTWTFATVGAYTTGPIIDSWVPAGTSTSSQISTHVVTATEGEVKFAAKVAPVSGNPARHRYAYALQNLDFDRQIKSVRIAFPTAGLILENFVFADGDGFAVNDWTAAVDATGVTWTAPSATTPKAEADYASLYSFRFDSDFATTAPGTATLGIAEAGTPTELSAATLTPGIPVAAQPGFYTLAPCRLLDTRLASGGSAPLASGTERVVAARGACGIPAEATAVVLNVTVTGSNQGGEVGLYAQTAAEAANRIRFTAAATRANNAIVALHTDGALRVQPLLTAAGSVDVILDVAGYFVAE
jgi:hypothetical protein